MFSLSRHTHRRSQHIAASSVAARSQGSTKYSSVKEVSRLTGRWNSVTRAEF